MAAQGMLVFDDGPVVTTTTGGRSGQAFIVLDETNDVLVFDAPVARQVSDPPDFDTDFIIFDSRATVVETLVAPADFLLVDPPKKETRVVLAGDELQDVMVITPGGPPGKPGPPGPPGGTYQHVQDEPAALWTVVHNLGTYPEIVLRLTSDPQERVHTDVFYVDENTALVEWPSPESGWADC